MKFPQKYRIEGEFNLLSGRKSNLFYDIEQMLLDPFYLHYIADNIPFSRHYVGILTGGLMMAQAAHMKYRDSRLSYVKKDNAFVGQKPEGEWMLIDDVVTTGGSLIKAISLAESHPKRIFVAVDRRDEKEKISGIEIETLFEI